MRTKTAQDEVVRRLRWQLEGLCPYCREHRPLVDHMSCPECNEKRKASALARYYANQQREQKRSRESARAARLRVLAHYGGRCVCCGETEPTFLAIDHINDDGHLLARGERGGRFLYWIIRNDFPNTLQLLCHNCNFAKRLGTCPHQAQRD